MKMRHRALWAALCAALAAGCSLTQGGDRASQDAAGDGETPEASGQWFDQCTPNEVPDEACYAKRRNPSSEFVALAREIADRQIEEHPAEGLNWNWEEAVLLTGIAELYRVTGEPRYLDYARAYMDYHIAKGYSIQTSDTCAPAAIAVYLYRENGEARYKKVVEDALHYLRDEARRTEQGGINHLGTLDLAVTLWLDSLFMFGSLLIGWGEAAGDASALDEFRSQFLIFTDLLARPQGFYLHAWGWPGEQDDDVFWARGNGWVAASAAMYLRVRRLRGDQDKEVGAAFSRLIEAVVGAQDKASGLWWTVLNRPGETYLETSASALFAFALARAYRTGYAGDEVLGTIGAAIKGLRLRIERDEQGRPTVTGISGPTIPGTFKTYAAVKLVEDAPYGIGAVILALIEASGLDLP